jgi:hypothetical protein
MLAVFIRVFLRLPFLLNQAENEAGWCLSEENL